MAEKQIIPTFFNKHYIGLDQGSNLTAMPDEAFYDVLNKECNEVGRVSTRPGTSFFIDTVLESTVTKVYDFKKDDGTKKIIAWAGTKIYDITNGTPVVIKTGLTNNLVPGVTSFQNRMYFGNGVDSNYKYDGTNFWDVSLEEPTGFPTLDTASAGSITLATGQKYVVTFYNSTTGEESNPYSATDLTGAPTTGVITSKKVVVTRPTAPTDPQISHWRIYKTTDGGGTFLQHATVAIGTSSYDDNTTVPATTIELEVDNDRAPLSEHWATFQGHLFCVPVDDLQAKRFCKSGNGAAWPLLNITWAGENDNDPITGIKNKNNLLWATKNNSTWILTEIPTEDNGVVPTKISDRGAVHKDASDGSDQNLFSFSQNKSFYKYQPTEQALSEIRYDYRSFNVKPSFDAVSGVSLSLVRVLNYTGSTKNQIFVAVPYGEGETKITRVFVYDTILSKMSPRDESWWPFKFGYDITSLNLVNINGDDVILIGTNDGWIHKYPDSSMGGDSAEENGTVTSATNTTLTDSTKSWAINELAGTRVFLISGTGLNQERQVLSNTSNTITVDSAWAVNPDTTTVYTVGGYDHYCYTNWKNFGNEALRKRSRAIRPILRQSGDYEIDIIAKVGFTGGDGEAQVLEFSLAGNDSLWGIMQWGVDAFTMQTLVTRRLKFNKKFNSIQYGFRKKLASTPFYLEGFTTFHQELYWKSNLL